MEYDGVLGRLSGFYPKLSEYEEADDYLRYLMADLKSKHEILQSAKALNYKLVESPEKLEAVLEPVNTFFFKEPVQQYPDISRQLTKRKLIQLKNERVLTELGNRAFYGYIKTFCEACKRMAQLKSGHAEGGIAADQNSLNKYLEHFRDLCS